jgi:hypothetical protein
MITLQMPSHMLPMLLLESATLAVLLLLAALLAVEGR